MDLSIDEISLVLDPALTIIFLALKKQPII